MDPLITLSVLKTAAGDNPAVVSAKDARYAAAINAASALVRSYTGLKFEPNSSSIATERLFEYDGSGYLDIDEAQSITAVSATAGFQGATPSVLTAFDWGAYPLNLPVKLWMRLPENYLGLGMSPAMGFERNLDTIGYRPVVKPTVVSITAIWGWPEIPADVQQATIWTALSIADAPTPYQQESIENYSRTRGPDTASEALPERAQLALLPYVIPNL